MEILTSQQTEQSRMDLHHEVFLMLMHGQLFNAPIQDPGHILDIGTGTGIWAIEVADTFPNSQVVGLDLRQVL